MKKKKILLVFGTISLSAVAVCGLILGSNNESLFSRAEQNDLVITLNSSNSPTLSSGSGSMVDAKGVKWEYSKASSLASGHVTLNNGGYMGVAADAAYGITGISSLTANFTKDDSAELWLATSYNGTTWYEGELLVSGQVSTVANNWRYVRLCSYDTNEVGIDISSVIINFSCSGISASDDVDAAANFSNLTYISDNLSSSEETSIGSTDDSKHAIRLTNITETTYGKNHNFKISLGETLTYSTAKSKTIELDYYYAEKSPDGNGQPQFQILSEGNHTLSASKTISSSSNPDFYSTLKEGWWHIAIPVSAFFDSVEDTQTIGGIRVFDYNIYNTAEEIGGFVVVDNLRIVNGIPSVVFDATTLYVNMSETVAIEPTISGTVHSKSFVSEDETIATVDAEGVVTGVAAGTTTVRATYSVGYLHQEFVQDITIIVSDPSSLYSTGNVATTSTVSVLNNADVTVTAVHNDYYGDGIKLTFNSDTTAESLYVLSFNLPANININGDNANSKFKMTAKYGIQSDKSYYYTNGQRYKLTNNDTRISSDGKSASEFNPVASGNNDDFYIYDTTISSFGVSSSYTGKADAKFNKLQLMIRPIAKAGSTMEFYDVQFYDVYDYSA